MNGFIAIPPYPFTSLPLIVRNAAWEVHGYVQAPESMVAMAFLGNLSMACQGLVDVKLPTGQVRPCSLNLLCIAESGERKSTIDGLVHKPFYDHDVQVVKAYEDARQAGEAPEDARQDEEAPEDAQHHDDAQQDGEVTP